MSGIERLVPRYAAVFLRFLLAEDELVREEALFEATEVGKLMLDDGPSIDQILELHRQAQRGLAEAWCRPDAEEGARAALARLADGEAMPLMLALMLPHDLAQRAHHERRWREEQGKAVALLEQTDDLVLVLDAAGAVESVNAAFLRATGWSRDEAAQRGAGLWGSLVPGRSTQHLRAELPRRDGSSFTVDWSASPILGRDGELLSQVCIGRDVTRQAQIEASLRENDKLRAVATLAAGIAHDFNNLLGSINGLAELCELQAEAGSRQARNLGRIRQAGDKAAALVRQMLDFSRQTPMAPQRLHLGELLAHAEGLLRAALPPQVSLSLHLADDGPVEIDMVQMEQVLLNVTRNAGQAMEGRAGSVRIAVERAQPTHAPAHRAGQAHLCLHISDDGQGIPPELLGKIFDPFFTTKPVGEGTGLGLAAVHGIVTRHGGVIEVASQPGAGSRFSIFLPLAGPQVCASDAEDKTETVGSASARPASRVCSTATEDTTK